MEQNVILETRCLHSLVKIFADEDLKEPAFTQGSSLIGEYYSFQVAYRSASFFRNIVVTIDSPLTHDITLRSVGLVPSELPSYEDHDDYLLRTKPGLYPDPLYDLEGNIVRSLPNQWRSVWITVRVTEKVAPGIHPISIRFTKESGEQLGEEQFQLEVIAASLPEQELIHTEWFYLDCLATEYKVVAFSDSHWKIIDAYLTNYVEYGMNMILTPLFTPPLEMHVGEERPTNQLIGVTREGERYTFDFSRLEKWMELCLSKGIQYFEFSHLFTQWGAKHAPKIIAETGGNEERIFGWETNAAGEEYRSFLTQFIPELLKLISARRLEHQAYFHVSDEPWIGDMPFYQDASTLLRTLIGDFPIIDALSDYQFYASGLLSHPVVSTEHIDTFTENHASNLWAYYCCCEYKDGLSNRFFNMPSERTRIIGAQLYKYDIQGFLHWGYNHWYSQKSVIQPIDPFKVTDADHGFPSGDAFLVYPGKSGPISSIRLAVMREAMQDVRALKLLEGLIGKQETMKCLEEDLQEPLTFRRYEKRSMWIINMRERINRLIKDRI
ncbi:DUF4091 domain-containing protein [Bacillus sp. FJAT-28004]|uniref:DUF4091 domain-containing protein n=1 Tax=Bacillus sp. FJAT-28004 TaxID=1679165 RepID=UPI0006B58886|nr:DUF4091 domain-containing protein [Bacillus sp. FJAT-28004]